jgi:type 1 glutamine amidotransferase
MSMTTRSALIVRGGWEGHQPVRATEVFLPFLEASGYDIRIEESPSVYADADAMAATDLIVQSVTMSTATHEEVMGLRAAVAAGTGLTGWHGGIADSYRASSDYLQLVGGQFATHPSRRPDLLVEGSEENNYLDYTVEITDVGRRHPITEGIDDFALTSEQYWVLHDDLNDVLATTTHPTQPWHPWHRPITSPAVWTRLWGRGRIVVTTPGHTPEVLQHPSVRTIIERGMLWATRTESE